jgi:hypothetical protein
LEGKNLSSEGTEENAKSKGLKDAYSIRILGVPSSVSEEREAFARDTRVDVVMLPGVIYRSFIFYGRANGTFM